MTKKDLAAALAAKTKLSKENAAKYTDAILEIISESLASGDGVSLIGFGTFSVADRAARTGRNPATGKKIKIPAKKVVKFKPGKDLRDGVNV